MEEVPHQARLAAEHPGVGEVGVVGDGGEHDGRPGGAGRGQDRPDPGDVLVHVDEHVVAPLGDPTAHVDDQHRRPLAEAEPLAESDAVVEVLLPVDVLHARPSSIRFAVAVAVSGQMLAGRGGQVSSHTRSVSGRPRMSSDVNGASGSTPDCSSRDASWRTCWVVCHTVRSSISWRLVVPK